jgi:hypothetical protein
MQLKLWFPLLITGVLMAQPVATPLPPPPPPPPAFMGMKGFPLSCFNQPNFAEDGLEFFVCNGGGGIAGVRKQNDPAHTIFVRNPDVALNLNMQLARRECENKQFFVRRNSDGIYSFGCQEKTQSDFERAAIARETPPPHRDEKFKPASKADWKRYDGHLK